MQILSVNPYQYHMENIWNASKSMADLSLKFKGVLIEFRNNEDMASVGKYLNELQCPYAMHEFVRRCILYALEFVEIGYSYNDKFVKLMEYLSVGADMLIAA